MIIGCINDRLFPCKKFYNKKYINHKLKKLRPDRGSSRLDPHYRSRLIALVIAMIAVCSAFSVSPVAGFRLENRDGPGAEATLVESLVLQESTKIREEFLENATVYIDSKSEKFALHEYGGYIVRGLYIPEEDAIYLRSDVNPERADEILVQQLGHRVYALRGFENSSVLPELFPEPQTYLYRISLVAGDLSPESVFANAFMLYHKDPDMLERDNPEIFRYISLLVDGGREADAAMVDALYLQNKPG